MSGYHAPGGVRYAARMALFFDLLATGRYDHRAGTSGAVTIPSGASVVAWSCYVDSGDPAGTVDITPGGAGQIASALPQITAPPGVGTGDDLVMGALGGGTIFTFAGTSSYWIRLRWPAGQS